MTSLLISETVGQKGVYSLLDSIYESNEVIPSVKIAHLINEAGISDDVFSNLTLAGLLAESPDGFYISSHYCPLKIETAVNQVL